MAQHPALLRVKQPLVGDVAGRVGIEPDANLPSSSGTNRVTPGIMTQIVWGTDYCGPQPVDYHKL